MKIYHCAGVECEKSLPNSPEDMFNESEVVYDADGEKKSLTVTYLRYFDTLIKEENIYDAEEYGVPFYHLAALLILMKKGGLVKGSRLYFNDTKKFLQAFDPADIDEALSIYRSLSSASPASQEVQPS